MDSARSHNQKTIDDLRSIDQDSTSILNEPANDLQTIQQFVGKTQEWSESGVFLSSKEVQEVNRFLESDSIKSMLKEAISSKQDDSINSEDKYGTLTSMQRATNHSTISNPWMCVPKDYHKETSMAFGTGLATLGLDSTRPIKSGGTLLQNGYGASQAAKHARIKAKGGAIWKEDYITAQGKETFRINVDKPELFGLKKKTYTEYNLNNGKPSEVRALVNSNTALKQAFNIKNISGKIGYLGLGLSTVSDITYGLNHNQSESVMAGYVISDTLVGLSSIAASASGGAYFGAMAGAWAGPVGAAFGFGIGLIVSYGLTEFKPLDIVGDGKLDSASDIIQKGATDAIEGVKNFFGHLF